jgi:ketosteroid isomerase-like protein
MGAKENTDLIREGYQAFQWNNLVAFEKILTEDCVWHVPGRGQLAGDKKGRQATVEYYGKLGELSGGTINIQLHDVVAGENHAIGLHHVSAKRGGKAVETTQAIVFHLRDGRVSEAWEHPFDLYGLDEVLG